MMDVLSFVLDIETGFRRTRDGVVECIMIFWMQVL